MSFFMIRLLTTRTNGMIHRESQEAGSAVPCRICCWHWVSSSASGTRLANESRGRSCWNHTIRSAFTAVLSPPTLFNNTDHLIRQFEMAVDTENY